MNNNLETLLYRSGLTANGSWDQMDQYDQEAVLRLLKMVVEECMLFCQRAAEVEYHCELSHSEKLVTSGGRAQARKLHSMIKDHFGIT
jgi:hypothetical protein